MSILKADEEPPSICCTYDDCIVDSGQSKRGKVNTLITVFSADVQADLSTYNIPINENTL